MKPGLSLKPGEIGVSGHVLAANMWHYPDCSATPIDNFDTAFWKSPVDAQPPAKKAPVRR